MRERERDMQEEIKERDKKKKLLFLYKKFSFKW
jgi:hypothetical protein